MAAVEVRIETELDRNCNQAAAQIVIETKGPSEHVANGKAE